VTVAMGACVYGLDPRTCASTDARRRGLRVHAGLLRRARDGDGPAAAGPLHEHPEGTPDAPVGIVGMTVRRRAERGHNLVVPLDRTYAPRAAERADRATTSSPPSGNGARRGARRRPAGSSRSPTGPGGGPDPPTPFRAHAAARATRWPASLPPAGGARRRPWLPCPPRAPRPRPRGGRGARRWRRRTPVTAARSSARTSTRPPRRCRSRSRS
jgi:hypothetical protein